MNPLNKLLADIEADVSASTAEVFVLALELMEVHRQELIEKLKKDPSIPGLVGVTTVHIRREYYSDSLTPSNEGVEPGKIDVRFNLLLKSKSFVAYQYYDYASIVVELPGGTRQEFCSLPFNVGKMEIVKH